jgi:hypothetical protein
VADIAWGPWQQEHITLRHGVSAQDFDTAWHDPDRRDLTTHHHPVNGTYYVSIGLASVGKPLKMVWRWQKRRRDTVWPITAFFPAPSASRRRRTR